MSVCPRCDGIGSVCQACDRPLDECECMEDSEPCPCDVCRGKGRLMGAMSPESRGFDGPTGAE